ncbi:hypothetical protein BSKO_01972 [Bryopsis sp. KO-2023]|nr:hypothetical protein BSKO_01972 [Bryopsis sp. KO-2023]
MLGARRSVSLFSRVIERTSFAEFGVGEGCSLKSIREGWAWSGQRLFDERNYGSLFWDESYVALNNISDPGGRKQRKRLGRGTGSGLGKTSGRGHKGQKARTGSNPKIGFEGGQTPIFKRFPKKGFRNPNMVEWVPLNLDRLKECIGYGKLDTTQTITMKNLRDSGTVGKKIKHGVKVLAKGKEKFDVPVHLQVSKCSMQAREAIEKAGGSVKLVYYNALGLRALLKPEAFLKKGRLIPRPVQRIPTKHAKAYDEVGEIPAPHRP